MSIAGDKESMRESFRRRRDSMNTAQRDRLSLGINEKLVEIIDVLADPLVHTFIPIQSEVNIRPFIQHCLDEKISVYSSKCVSNRQLEHIELRSLTNLLPGRFGTLYPPGDTIREIQFDFIIVPGLAFDKNGNRIGYGAGYYDRFLAGQPEAFKVGVCFPFQLTKNLVHEKHDIPLNVVLSSPPDSHL